VVATSRRGERECRVHRGPPESIVIRIAASPLRRPIPPSKIASRRKPSLRPAGGRKRRFLHLGAQRHHERA
jgi:hypothetical protein